MKKFITLILAAAITITAVIGGTIAFLNDTDDAVDVMTIGDDIDIEQHELQRSNDGGYVAFKQGQELSPVYATSYDLDNNGFWKDVTGAIDKLVVVENKGGDTFFRTWIAVECPDGEVGFDSTDKELDILLNVNDKDYDWKQLDAKMELDGQTFVVFCATYKTPLAAGATAPASLRQIAMTSAADQSLTKGLGRNFEVLAFSQAIQTKNLTNVDTTGYKSLADAVLSLPDAFGTDVPWEDAKFDITVSAAKTAEDLEAALSEGKTVYLADDLVITEPIDIAQGTKATLDLNGYTLTTKAHKSVGAAIKNNGTLTIMGGTIKSEGANGGSAILNNGELTVLNATLNGAPQADDGTENNWPSYTVNNAGVMTITDSEITSVHGAVASYGEGAVVTLNNTDINMTGIAGFTSHAIYTYSNGKVIVNGGNIANNANDQSSTGGSVLCGDITVISGTFTGRINSATINGGTFSVDPQKFATQNPVKDNGDGTWTVYPVNDTWDGTADTSWYPTVAAAAETDEETSTVYKLYTAEQLAGLADLVNVHGVTLKGATIELMVNVDLQNKAWTSIGISSKNYPNALKANFDGGNHTVSNLKVSNTGWAGLFGVVHGADIKNVKLVNVTLDSNRMTGSLVGQLYGSIDNCHVTNAKITVVPNLEDDGVTYNNGDKVGGLVGWIGDNNNNRTLTNCTATNVTLKAYRDVGGLAGYAADSTTIKDNTVSNIKITIDQETGYYGDEPANEGLFWGRSYSGKITSSNNTVKVDETKTAAISSVSELKNAFTNGGEYILAANLSLDADETITLDAGKTLTIDLDGKTIAGVSDANSGNREMFLVKGNLTMKNGTVTMKHAGENMGWSAMATVFDVTAGGVLNIDDATVENLGGTDMAFVAHLNNWGEVTLNVDNSTIKSTYIPVRLFNGGYDDNNVTIENSTLNGGSYCFWVHNYIGDLDTTKHTDEAINARLKLDIYGNNNEFITTKDYPVLFGFNTYVMFDENGYIVKEAVSQEEIKMQVASAKDGAVINVTEAGTYELSELGVSGKNIKFAGTKDVVFNVSSGIGVNGANLTFDGVTIKGTTDNYKGIQHSGDIVYNNVIFDNAMFLYGVSETFNNCTFNLTSNYLWTYGATNVAFNNCTFNTNGKAILVYNEQATTSSTKTINVNGCTFNAENKGYTGSGDWCAAVEIGTGSPFVVNFTGNNIVSENFSGLWRDKGQGDNNLVVVNVDGTQVHSAK